MTQAAISELSMQAASGILSVHGRSSGPSGTLGLDYLAVLSSAMSLQATLAAALGQLRGGRFSTVSVSPLGCGLLSIGQYLAGATAAQDPEQLLAGSYDPGLRPPFISQDGVVFELETLDPRPWRVFWEAVGVPADLAGQAWKAFLLRYAKAVCPMPVACLSSLQTLNFARLQELALQTGMAILPVRTPAQRQSDRDYGALAGLWQHQTHTAPGSLAHLAVQRRFAPARFAGCGVLPPNSRAYCRSLAGAAGGGGDSSGTARWRSLARHAAVCGWLLGAL